MRYRKPEQIVELALALMAFVLLSLVVVQLLSPAVAAAEQTDEEKIWMNEKLNILTLVPKNWSWKDAFAADVPVVFLPTEKKKDIPNFIFVTYLGKQTTGDLENLKKDYIKGLEDDLADFKLNSAENVTTIEGLQACDLSYTFAETGKSALGYDRLVSTTDNIMWAISFSAGTENFKELKDGAISIIDSFIFDATKWLAEHQKNK